ncbi:hypothetical protein OEZ86_003528 [Tetradesmus obliquus]|nr:hypothetical protein OEZ86_003528 [Tetradesmus obliquus]
MLLATLLLIAAAGVAALRAQWDLAGAVAGAWLLVLLSQVLQRRTSSSSSSSSVVELVEADAQVELVDAEPAKLPDLSGTWIKDNAASDSMEAAVALVHLNGITRTAVRLIKGMKLSLDDSHFAFGVFSVISWFKITERYVLGQPCQHRRRDLRRGRSTNVARLTPWGSVVIEYEWGAPHAGRGVDEFKLDEEGRLVLECKLMVGGQTAGYRHVYNRKH